jgi:hypothetical protein
MEKIENTVPAENQMKNSTTVSFLGAEDAPVKILIVGNSITRHGPNAEIGWPCDWGMAASSVEKDYVHRLFALLTESGKNVHIRVRQASHWERNYKDAACLADYEEDRAFQPDILIFRLGENAVVEDKNCFRDAIRAFVKFLSGENTRVIFTTCFWDNPKQDDPIRAVAEEMHCPCADIAGRERSMMALGLFEHSGVAVHPSDEGMEMIARKIFACI